MSLLDPSVSLREARITPLASGDTLEAFGTARTCSATDCTARLSRYNPGATCALHRGWRDQPQTRRRRH